MPGRPRRQLAAGCVVDSFEPPVGAGGDAEGCADSSVCFRRTTLRFWLWGPAPAQLKLLGGRSPGRDSGGRRVTPPAAFERVAPECPDWLPPGAKDMWGRVVPELAALNLLKESDLGVLTSFCVAWDQLMQAVTAYREQGFIATNARSRRVTVHPAVAAARAATRDVLVLARELGCTPSAEANLAAVLAAAGDPDDDEFNPFAPDR
ncbi:phage terminase small subunit P27 family [Mycobacterium tuberculosis]|uniref:phage terminase small subunit P27 family n=1 Tax=Mycobacterium tuberculosis TaxID=1773 RepID=UPI002351E89C|nr:phage terminase small subunit P27 family [Mycobacterium tuberculosis]